MKQKDKSKDHKIQLINKAKNDINPKKHLKLYYCNSSTTLLKQPLPWDYYYYYYYYYIIIIVVVVILLFWS